MRDLREGDRRASAFEGGLRLFGLLLVDLLQDGLRSVFHELLGLLESEAGESTDLFDDGDLVSAIGFEDDVELVLVLSGRSSGVFSAGRGGPRLRQLLPERQR